MLKMVRGKGKEAAVLRARREIEKRERTESEKEANHEARASERFHLQLKDRDTERDNRAIVRAEAGKPYGRRSSTGVKEKDTMRRS